MPITRKQFLKSALWGGASMVLMPRGLEALQVSGPPLDLVIRGGLIVDGTGRPAFGSSISATCLPLRLGRSSMLADSTCARAFSIRTLTKRS
jgi:hypothetical protein